MVFLTWIIVLQLLKITMILKISFLILVNSKNLLCLHLKHQEDIEANPLIISQAMQNSFFNIAIEAYYVNYQIDYPYLTEKTWRNFKCRMPFVLIGQKHSLKQLHELGYKTFHPFIDESYDDRMMIIGF